MEPALELDEVEPAFARASNVPNVPNVPGFGLLLQILSAALASLTLGRAISSKFDCEALPYSCELTR